MINKNKNKKLINTIKQAGFKSISDFSRKIDKSRDFIIKNPKVIQMLLNEIIKRKEIEAKYNALEIVYKESINEKEELKEMLKASRKDYFSK